MSMIRHADMTLAQRAVLQREARSARLGWAAMTIGGAGLWTAALALLLQ